MGRKAENMTKKEAWRVADNLAAELLKEGLVSGHLRLVRDKVVEHIKELQLPIEREKEKKKGLIPPESMSDDELRLRLREHLISKLGSGELQAAEIAQLKDLFGLASKANDLVVELVDYKNATIDCPHCGDNIFQTVTKIWTESFRYKWKEGGGRF